MTDTTPAQGYLFIGGPYDGTYRAVTSDATVWRYAIMESLTHVRDLTSPPSVQQGLYQKQIISSVDGRKIYVFVEDSMPFQSVLQRLIENYRPPSADNHILKRHCRWNPN